MLLGSWSNAASLEATSTIHNQPLRGTDCVPYHAIGLHPMTPRLHPGLVSSLSPERASEILVQGDSELGTFRMTPGWLFTLLTGTLRGCPNRPNSTAAYHPSSVYTILRLHRCALRLSPLLHRFNGLSGSSWSRPICDPPCPDEPP